MSDQLLWTSKKAKHTKPKQTKPVKPTKPTEPVKPAPQPGISTQGSCVAVNTIGLQKGGQEIIQWPGCMSVTLYESITSNAAQTVLKQNPNAFFPGGYPAKPEASGLLVTIDRFGVVQNMFAFAKGTVFALENDAIAGGSYYTFTCPKPNSTFRAQPLAIKSPDIQVTIPANLYGGPSKDCGLGGPASATPKP